jgi:carbamoyltransferase
VVNVLGINSVYHESAAALLVDGKLVAAVEEERFNRIKHGKPAEYDNPHQLPERAIRFCLKQAGLTARDVNHVAYSFDPKLRRTRFRTEWWDPKVEEVFRLRLGQVRSVVEELFGRSLGDRLHFIPHHMAHAASAYFPSGFDRAAILTIDGIGESAGSSLAKAEGTRIQTVETFEYPHSIGFLWEVFSAYLGFSHYDASKVMGLAAYGDPEVYREQFTSILGSDEVNYGVSQEFLGMNSDRFTRMKAIFGPERSEDGEFLQRHADMAAALQAATDGAVTAAVRRIKRRVPVDNLCLAGGVALNCVTNEVVRQSGDFAEVFIPSAPHDASTAIGAALVVHCAKQKKPPQRGYSTPYLGPRFNRREILAAVKSAGLTSRRSKAPAREAADMIADGKIVAWFQGRMEFGPRALGHRSIIGDARSPAMQSIMNLKIKYRESFRPFAPAVLDDQASKYFDIEPGVESPYMLLVADVQPELRVEEPHDQQRGADLRTWVNEVRSSIPAVTHVDYSARLQTVARDSSPDFYAIIEAFDRLTGCPVVINTSFNVRGEPIVCTPDDAYRCFMRTEMDTLVLEDCILRKRDQPEFADTSNWHVDFILD